MKIMALGGQAGSSVTLSRFTGLIDKGRGARLARAKHRGSPLKAADLSHGANCRKDAVTVPFSAAWKANPDIGAPPHVRQRPAHAHLA